MTVQAAQIEADNVLDYREYHFLRNVTSLGIPIPDHRRVEHAAAAIDEAGNVLLIGNFEQNDSLTRVGDPERPKFRMWSTLGDADGKPTVVSNEATGWELAGGTAQYLETYVVSGIDGYYAINEHDLDDSGSRETLQITAYSNVSSGTPTLTHIASFNRDTHALDFPSPVPNVDATTSNGAPPTSLNIDFVSSDGSQIVFNAYAPGSPTNAFHAYYTLRRDDNGSEVVRLIGEGDTVPASGGKSSFVVGEIWGAGAIGDAGLRSLLVTDAATEDMVLVGIDQDGSLTEITRNGASIAGLDEQTVQLVDSFAKVSTDGKVAFKSRAFGIPGQTFVADPATGDYVATAGAPITDATVPGSFLSVGNEAHFDSQGRLVLRGSFFDASSGVPPRYNGYVGPGIFIFDDKTQSFTTALMFGEEIGDSGFELETVTKFVTHQSGALILFAEVRGGSGDGQSLLVLDPDGTLRPIILPGDTVALADGTILNIEHIRSDFATGFGEGNPFLNAAGIGVFHLADYSQDLEGMFRIDLSLATVPEPASITCLLAYTLTVGRRRRARH